MKEIKPIETCYNGYKFRSRLEARWAVFFDAAGIEYEYEPEGFRCYDGGCYLPDFYLRNFDTYAEVKGSYEQLERDWRKIYLAIDYDMTPISRKGLIILGQIPYKEWNIPVFPFLSWYKGVVSGLCLFDIWHGVPNFYEPKTAYREVEWFNSVDLYGVNRYMDYAGSETRINCGYITTECQYVNEIDNNFVVCTDTDYINNCYKQARQARFEHGEKPIFTSDRKKGE